MVDIECREGLPGFHVTWPWHQAPLPPGLTCVFRVRNEARSLPWALPPILRAVQQVVLVDNGSEDGTADVGRRVAAESGAAERYTALHYPFEVSRAGQEHLRTPADSVHSLTHFYNWSFSHVRTAYSMKWDGDMVLTPEGEAALADLSWQLEGSETVVVVPRHPLTVVDDRTGWLDLGMRFLEPWIYPMGPEFTFVKAFEWEVREWPERCERLVLPEGLCVELKWLDADEFSHWTDVGDFNAARAPRKQREWQVDRAIREGRAETVDGLVRVTAPPGVHIVDHVTRTWLPQAPRPLVRPDRPRPAALAPAPPDPLTLLEDGPRPILALVHEALTEVVARLPAGTTVVSLPCPEVPRTGRWGTVVVLAPDRDAFQRMVATMPALQGTRTVAVYLEYAHEAVPLTPRKDWERILAVTTRRAGDSYLDLARFAGPVIPRRVLAEFARQSVRRSLTPHQGLRVAVVGPALAPPGEVLALRLQAAERAGDADLDVPPDLVLTERATAGRPEEHHAIGRAPAVVTEHAGELSIGPLEERILNPEGFDREPTQPAGELAAEGSALVLRLGGRDLTTTPGRGATEQMVRATRPHQGVRISWPVPDLSAVHRTTGLARTVAGLAMAGVPLVADEVPPWAGRLLGPRVSAALSAPVDLTDELAREEHSIVLRRAALGEFSMPAWRARVADDTGLRPPATPQVSVVLATRREDMLEHAVAQVRRQRGLDFELVLAPHGFEVDPARVAELAGRHVHTVVLPRPGEELFGDVLADAAAAASGDLVVKMDDDDWYGPDVLTDLLLAKRYSGGDLVGMPAEYVYLVPTDVTVRRTDFSEGAGRFVAGGTMMIERSLLRALGGFRPVRRYVDASLLADVLDAGGLVYRTQGLGYVFRRGDSGHTWEADLDLFLDPERLRFRWDGFVPSRLLEAD